MVVYGKTVAGGMPIGVVCGRKALMNRFDPERPLRVAYVIGTFSAHPVVMGAMNEFLRWVMGTSWSPGRRFIAGPRAAAARPARRRVRRDHAVHRGLPSWATQLRPALGVNRWFNHARRVLGFGYWSLSAYVKSKVKSAVDFVSDFEHALAVEAGRRGLDSIVCGHIHRAEMRPWDGVLYCNTGDWVESCTALVEHEDGHLELPWRLPAAHPRTADRISTPGVVGAGGD